jgi:hypothetical protein
MTDTLSIFSSVFTLANVSERQRDALAAVNPSLASEFVRCVYREAKNNPHAENLLRHLITRAEESGLSVSEWLSDVVLVYQWLARHNQTANVVDTVEYVSCALEGSALQMGHSIEWYLESHGFANAIPLARGA